MIATRLWRRLAATAALVFTAVWLWPGPLVAASGGEKEGQFQVFLLLVVIVGVAYLVTHLLLERIAERFGIVTGIEYVFLGAIVFHVVVAPLLPGADGAAAAARLDELFRQLQPILVLGTGSLGLLWGTHLDTKDRDEIDRAALGPAVIISFVTFVSVAGIPAAVAGYVMPFGDVVELAPVLIFAGAIALVAADAPIRTMESFLRAEGPAPKVAHRVAHVCSAIAIVVFGSIFGFDNGAVLIREGALDWLSWLAVHLGVGMTLGVVFATYLQKEFPEGKILTVVIGMVVFTSGIAHGLSLSPIFVNFVLGVVLVNSSEHGAQVREMLESIKHPVYIVLFIFAGGHLDISVPFWVYALAGPYLVLRIAGRLIGGYLAERTSTAEGTLPNMGRVLFAPGGLSVAMALDFMMVYSNRSGEGAGLFFGAPYDLEAVFAAIIVAIVVSEILAHTMTRDWMIDASMVKAPISKTDEGGTAKRGGE